MKENVQKQKWQKNVFGLFEFKTKLRNIFTV